MLLHRIRLGVVLLVAVVAVAQDSPAPTFRTTTRLVEVSLVALEGGKPITDLRKEDIVLTENGKPRTLAFFRYDGSPERAVITAPKRLGVFANSFPNTPETRPNITAVLFDTVNTDPADQKRAYSQVIRYVQTLDPGTRLSLFHLGTRGVSILHNFTDDTESLRARIEGAPKELPAQGIADIRGLAAQYEQLAQYIGTRNIDMLQQSIAAEMRNNAQVRRNRLLLKLSALEAIGRHLSAIPGRKNLVWIGGGMSLVTIIGSGLGPGGDTVSHVGDLHATAERLSQFGVSLYIVDPRGVTVPPGFLTGSTPGTGMFQREIDFEQVNTDPRLAMALMASVTGGRVFNSNDVSDAVRQTVLDNGGTYLLGFYTPDEPDGKWRRLRLSTKRTGVRLLYRQGYVAERVADTLEAWGNQRWESLISNPLGSALIPITAHAERGSVPGTLALNALISAPHIYFRNEGESRLGEIEVCLAELTRQGKAEFFTESTSLKLPPEQWKVLETSGIPYARTWKVGPGAVTVRMIVRDRLTGRFGTLDIPLAQLRR